MQCDQQLVHSALLNRREFYVILWQIPVFWVWSIIDTRRYDTRARQQCHRKHRRKKRRTCLWSSLTQDVARTKDCYTHRNIEVQRWDFAHGSDEQREPQWFSWSATHDYPHWKPILWRSKRVYNKSQQYLNSFHCPHPPHPTWQYLVCCNYIKPINIIWLALAPISWDSCMFTIIFLYWRRGSFCLACPMTMWGIFCDLWVPGRDTPPPHPYTLIHRESCKIYVSHRPTMSSSSFYLFSTPR